jgi:hypothetical protein
MLTRMSAKNEIMQLCLPENNNFIVQSSRLAIFRLPLSAFFSTNNAASTDPQTHNSLVCSFPTSWPPIHVYKAPRDVSPCHLNLFCLFRLSLSTSTRPFSTCCGLMSAFVPERPTLPPLRSLALPMHGVPSRLTLPSIQSVRSLIPNTGHRSLTLLIHRIPMPCSADGRNVFPPPHLYTRRLLRLNLSQVPLHPRYTIHHPPTHNICIRRIPRNHMFALSSPIPSKTPMPLLCYAQQVDQMCRVHPG